MFQNTLFCLMSNTVRGLPAELTVRQDPVHGRMAAANARRSLDPMCVVQLNLDTPAELDYTSLVCKATLAHPDHSLYIDRTEHGQTLPTLLGNTFVGCEYS